MLNPLRRLMLPSGRNSWLASLNPSFRSTAQSRPEPGAGRVCLESDLEQRANDLFLALGLPALAFDSHGCARLLFHGQLMVDFESDVVAGLLHLYTDLGRLPAHGCETLYRSLLEANLVGAKTVGATLSVDASRSVVVLSRSLHVAALDPAKLSHALAAFVQTAVHWRGVLTPSLGHAERVAQRADDLVAG